MTATIEDACFTASAKIRIDRVAADFAFRHCSFEGCEIFVADEVDATIFTRCIFRGAIFSGQPLSPRIASDCHKVHAEIEMAAPPPASPQKRFRR
jgi:hypothetical protein